MPLSSPAPRPVDGSTSVVLDSLRLLAALTVLIFHVIDLWFPGRMHEPTAPGDVGHASVTLFFVLSGFVIAYTTSANHRGLSAYMQARLTRLCSVVIPALVLTAVVEVILRLYVPAELQTGISRGNSAPRYLVSAFFLNEIWFFSAAPPLNQPLWSLGFEFWYYVIFGLWFCTGRGLKSWLLAGAACLVAGPKILIMMPIWLMGCAAYRLPRPVLTRPVGWAAFAAALGAALAAVMLLPPMPFTLGRLPLIFANQFLTDWAIGLLVSLALWLLPGPAAGAPVRPSSFARSYRRVADLTFPIYVLHFPLLLLCRQFVGFKAFDAAQALGVFIAVLLATSALGWALDALRPHWTRLFAALFGWLGLPARKAVA